MDFVNGASMLVGREFLEAVGLMEESYFLYFEELDWAKRARGKFTLGPHSVRVQTETDEVCSQIHTYREIGCYSPVDSSRGQSRQLS
jgi:hypothetical protein